MKLAIYFALCYAFAAAVIAVPIKSTDNQESVEQSLQNESEVHELDSQLVVDEDDEIDEDASDYYPIVELGLRKKFKKIGKKIRKGAKKVGKEVSKAVDNAEKVVQEAGKVVAVVEAGKVIIGAVGVL